MKTFKPAILYSFAAAKQARDRQKRNPNQLLKELNEEIKQIKLSKKIELEVIYGKKDES